MKTIIYQSDAMAKHLRHDFCPNVIIHARFVITREKQYDTPFGPSYSLVKSCAGVDKVFLERPRIIANDVMEVIEEDVTAHYEKMMVPNFYEEVREIIKQHEGYE